MCCMRLAENTGRKNDAKNRYLGTIAQLCRAISSQLRHASTIGKSLLSSSISSTCCYNMVNFGSLAAETVSLVWGTPANFNGFRVLASLLQRRRFKFNGSQPNFARCLAVFRAATLHGTTVLSTSVHICCLQWIHSQRTYWKFQIPYRDLLW